MGHCAQTLLGNKFSGETVYAVGFVFDAHKCILQMGYKLGLALSHTACFLLAQGLSALFERLERRRSIGSAIAVGIHHIGAEKVIFLTGLFELFKNEDLEFLKLLVGVTFLFSHCL